MSDSFFGAPSFGAPTLGFNGQNAASITDHSSKAVLFIFKPYAGQFGDIGVRSFQYQFDGNFLHEASEVTDLTKNGSAPDAAILNDFMGRHNFSDHMMPAWQAELGFAGSRLNDKYRFILVLTEKPSGLIGANTFASTVGSSQVRRIYTGFFMDEPYNPQTLTSSSRTLNPNGMMVFTHKSVIGSAVEHGAHGARHIVRTRASEEIINTQISKNLMMTQDPGLELMTPANCVSSIETTSDGYAMAITGGDNSTLLGDPGHHVMSDVLEQPTHNVATIFRGMMRYQSDMAQRGRLMTNNIDGYYENDFMGDDAHRQSLGRFMDIPRFKNTSMFDLSLDTPYSAESINQLVNGDLDVHDFDLPRPMFYDTANQFETNMINQYSYLIAMVIGPILNSAGLNAMQFVYEIKQNPGLPLEQFYTISAEPHFNSIATHEVVMTAKAVEMELVKGIFRTIFESKGSFRVEVHANVTGNTVVRLDLIDQGAKCLQDFEIATCLGGLISPLIGNSRSMSHNQSQVMGLYNQATGTASGTNGFLRDDEDFMSLAEDVFNQSALKYGGGVDPNNPDGNGY